MDIIRVFDSLRPDAEYVGNQRNSHSLEFIGKTYIADTIAMPTQSEMEAEWIRIQEQDVLDEVAANNLAALDTTDKDMARLAEDMYDYLVAADPAFEAAMPQSVKDKVANRKVLRGKL